MLVIDVPKQFEGAVMQAIGNRRGELVKMDVKGNMTHMEFSIPARGLIGLRTRLLNGTQGEAIMHHTFHDYQLASRRSSRPAERRAHLHGKGHDQSVRPR